MRSSEGSVIMERKHGDWTTVAPPLFVTNRRRRLLRASVLFFWLVVELTQPHESLAGLERPHYETAYACEGRMLNIGCDEGQLIHLIRANYGRFSITICNEHGNTDWSVNCIAPRSFRVLQERCHQVARCSLNVTSTLFEDPCPGTYKYLEVQYNCSLAATTTASTPARFAPPWLMPTTQPPWVTLVTRTNLPPDGGVASVARPSLNTDSPNVALSVTKSPDAVDDVAVVVPSLATSSPAAAAPKQPPLVVASVDNGTALQPAASPLPPHVVPAKNATEVPPRVDPPASATSSSAPIIVPTTASTTIRWEFRENFCSPIRVRDLYWNWTKQGDTAVIPCPSGTTGQAKWLCSSRPVRWTEYPDMSDCKSQRVTSLATSVENRHSLVGVAVELVKVTRNKGLYGGDMVETATLLKKMAHKMSERVKMSTGSHRESLVEELMKPVVETGSNMLSSEQRHIWNDLSRQMQMKTATALLLGLEENAYLLADQVNYEKVVVQSDTNILMSIKVVRTQNIRDLNFPEPEDLSNSVWSSVNGGDMISLPSEALLDRAVNGFVKVIFFTYNNLDELLQPPTTGPSSWPSQPTAGNGSSGGGKSRGTKMLNSRVISASFGRKHNQPLGQPVFVILKHMHEENVSNPTCVYWDYSRSTWSPSGCEVVSTNFTHTICACNHLTNFALLMDIQGVQLSYGHEVALQVITYVGCAISIVCLSLAFLTFSCFGGLNSDRNTIHKNLCACLLIAELLFVMGVSQTDKPILCGVVAGLLHFFFLCSFAWMFLEGFQLYVMLIEVFESERSRVRWYYAVAYGTSALVVVVSCAIDPFSYGTDRHCWLRADNYFIFSFVGPVIAILVANFVFLSIAVFMMCRHANSSASMKKKEHSRLANISGLEGQVVLHVRTRHLLGWIRGALVLVFLLGLTWTFGLLYLNKETVIMAYVFTVLNSLQGLFIFVFHCLQNEKVQKEYRKLVRLSPCVPECVREVAKERRSSFYVNSNCTASVPHSSSTPVPPSHLNHHHHNNHHLDHQQHLNHNQLEQHQQSYLKRLWGSGKTKSPQTSSLNGGLGTPTPGTPGRPTAPEPEVERFSSFKSSNRDRDSGHGGSEPEESIVIAGGVGGGGSLRHNHHHHNNNNKKRNNSCDNGVTGNDLSAPADCSISDCSSDYFRDKLANELQRGSARSMRRLGHNHHHQQPQHFHSALHQPQAAHLHHHRQVRLSPLNHIYMDIESRECEPVYEEIDRSEAAALHQLSSDFSDEDGRRRSDISRQSSGSYGDNRPLIGGGQLGGNGSGGGNNIGNAPVALLPHPQQPNRTLDAVLMPQVAYNAPPYHAGPVPPIPQPIGIVPLGQSDIANGALSNGFHAPTESAVQQHHHGNHPQRPKVSDNSMFVAMLDGRKVVCRLQGKQDHQPQQQQLHYPQQQHHRLSHSEC